MAFHHSFSIYTVLWVVFIHESICLINNDWPTMMYKHMLTKYTNFIENMQEISYASQLLFALKSLSLLYTPNFIISNWISHDTLKYTH